MLDKRQFQFPKFPKERTEKSGLAFRLYVCLAECTCTYLQSCSAFIQGHRWHMILHSLEILISDKYIWTQWKAPAFECSCYSIVNMFWNTSTWISFIMSFQPHPAFFVSLTSVGWSCHLSTGWNRLVAIPSESIRHPTIAIQIRHANIYKIQLKHPLELHKSRAKQCPRVNSPKKSV